MPTDKQLVASKQDYEVSYISTKFELPKHKVEEIMLQVGKDGRPCRSRKVIYKAIREMQDQKAKQKEILVEMLNDPINEF